MIKEYIIGREGNQSFPIDGDKYNAVSRRHARLTVDEENGEWYLQDEGSSNGTFILDEQGQLVPVISKVRIQPTTHISLGGARYNALTFVAHAAVEGGNDFSYDFDLLEKKLTDLKKRMENKRKRMKIRRVGLSLIPIVFILLPIDASYRYGGVALSSMLNAVLGGMEGGDALREERRRTLVCPKCRRQLSDTDIERHSCPCGAH